jgi:hypothetical protein
MLARQTLLLLLPPPIIIIIMTVVVIMKSVGRGSHNSNAEDELYKK